MDTIKSNFSANDFNDKVMLITGSSSGMGAGAAIYFAKLGANVVVTGRDATKVNSVAKECRQHTDKQILEVLVDLQNDSEVRHLVDKTIAFFGKIHILVNCAGIVDQGNIRADQKYMQSFDRIINTNLRPVVFLTSLVVPFLEQTKGCIVNVSSISSLVPRRTWSSYGMSKCGIDMLTKCLAMELGPKGIRVNSILPSIVLTPMINTIKDMAVSEEDIIMFCRKTYPLQRPGVVDDVTKAIEFLASNRSAFITGSLIPLDGGSIISKKSRL
ncbi:3-oxoacyl-[acyl-carrier-protein] reductase FabG-like [Oppia nitens]|uniref:3-oxoacyl-[acyl-carrier-protein] reductase FabG-like n=1 Tax=Oppia nitens TaxID=1686743 RepID=UPI0023D9885A|nr:3-oxoacyl-[acyl-carrier-protein] reductase FabG-like [Oppia nitens]